MSGKINKKVAFISENTQWLAPVQLGIRTILNVAQAPETLETVLSALEKLNPDPFLEFTKDYYRYGLKTFGGNWGYLDQLTVLHAATVLLQPESYLEIGTFRGRSISVVANSAPTCQLVSFDMWMPDYADMGSPGPEYVQDQLNRIGHSGGRTFISGNSFETVPQYFQDNPDMYFDLVTVDGDHSEEGARKDLLNVIEHLKIGGVLVFDDITHPKHPWLERIWDEVVGEHPDYLCGKFTEVGHGVAFAIRKSVGDNSARKTDRVAIVPGSKVLLAEQRAKIEELSEYALKLENSFKQAERDGVERLELLERSGLRIQQMEEQIRVLDQQVQQLNPMVWQRDRQIEQMDKQIGQMDQQIGEMDQQLERTVKQLQELRILYERANRLLLSIRDTKVFKTLRFFRQWEWVEQEMGNL